MRCAESGNLIGGEFGNLVGGHACQAISGNGGNLRAAQHNEIARFDGCELIIAESGNLV